MDLGCEPVAVMDQRVLRHDDFRAHLPAGAKRLGLTTKEEQAWCRWYGAEVYEGRGVIVEWGAWLGSLTSSYCEGLTLNSRLGPTPGRVAYVYDLFQWEEWCEDQVKGTEHANTLALGQSYATYFRELHRPYDHLLDVRAADLSCCKWDGLDIQLVVNDAVKTPAVGANVFREFLPSLVPGGLLANQDYLWPTDAFLAVLMYQARDFFDFEYTLPDSCMVIFRCRRTFDPDVVRLPPTLSAIDPALFAEAFAWSRRTVSGTPTAMIDLGHAVTLWQAGWREEAQRMVRDARLADEQGSPMYEFQLDVLRMWGYGELLG